MNIFYIDEDPRQCAKWMVDKHVLQMIRESAQLLSTAHRVLDGTPIEVEYQVPITEKMRKKKVWILGDSRNDILYQATHINHPCAVWVRQSVENYNWLVDHLFALGDEYRYRYDKPKAHATIARMGYEIQSPPNNLKEWDATPVPCCMPDQYKFSDDPVINYRVFYRGGKSHLHKWKKRDKPEWIP